MWCLAAGVVLNIAVAWAAAVWGWVRPGTMVQLPAGHARALVPFWESHRELAPDERPDEEVAVVASGPGLSIDQALGSSTSVTVVRAGWPLHSLRWFDLTEDDVTQLKGRRSGYELENGMWALPVSGAGPVTFANGNVKVTNSRLTWTWSLERRLPMDPIWIGFAGNTLFYTALAFMLLFGPGQIRRVWRSRNLCCVNCGYSLAGNTSGVCPECGTPRTRSNRVHE